MSKKTNSAVEWLVSQLNGASYTFSSTYSVRIDIPKELINEAIRLEKHEKMNEWHEGYEEGRLSKVHDGESGLQIKAIDYFVSEALCKNSDWFLKKDVNIDQIIEKAKEIEHLNNELSYKKGASDEIAFLTHLEKNKGINQ